jgi:hypothetical protein
VRADFSNSRGVGRPNEELTITFVLRQHADVPLTFRPRDTVGDARRRLSGRYEIAPDDIVLLHQGRSLGDALILSRLRLRAGMKIHVFLKETPEIILRSGSAMHLELAVNHPFKFRNLATDEEITLRIGAAANIQLARRRVAEAVHVHDPKLVTILNGLAVVEDIAVLSQVPLTDGVFGFTINSPEVGEFAELQRNFPLDDDGAKRLGALGEKIIFQLAPGERQKIQSLITDSRSQYEAAALFLRANRRLEALSKGFGSS